MTKSLFTAHVSLASLRRKCWKLNSDMLPR
jgi:hypothetical protein